MQTKDETTCKSCGEFFNADRLSDGERLTSVGICFDCDHAMLLFGMKNQPETVRIDGQHYRIGSLITMQLDETMSLDDVVAAASKQSSKNKGMGGRVHAIAFTDGRVVFTNDLWHQGNVPDSVKHLLPDNARFLEV